MDGYIGRKLTKEKKKNYYYRREMTIFSDELKHKDRFIKPNIN